MNIIFLSKNIQNVVILQLDLAYLKIFEMASQKK